MSALADSRHRDRRPRGLDALGEGRSHQSSENGERDRQDQAGDPNSNKIELLPIDQQNIHYTQTVLESVRRLSNPEITEIDSQRVKASVEEEIKGILNMEVSNSRKMQLVCELLEEIYQSIDALREECRSISFRGTANERGTKLYPKEESRKAEDDRRPKFQRPLDESGPRVSHDSFIPRRLELSQLDEDNTQARKSNQRFREPQEAPALRNSSRAQSNEELENPQDEMIDIQGYSSNSERRPPRGQDNTDEDNPHTFGDKRDRFVPETRPYNRTLNETKLGKSYDFASKNTTAGEGAFTAGVWTDGKENAEPNRPRNKTPEPPLRDDGLITLGLQYLNYTENHFTSRLATRMSQNELTQLKEELRCLFNDIRNVTKFFKALCKLCGELYGQKSEACVNITNNVHNLWRWVKELVVVSVKSGGDYQHEDSSPGASRQGESTSPTPGKHYDRNWRNDRYGFGANQELSSKFLQTSEKKSASRTGTNNDGYLGSGLFWAELKAILEREFGIPRSTPQSLYCEELARALKRHHQLYHGSGSTKKDRKQD